MSDFSVPLNGGTLVHAESLDGDGESRPLTEAAVVELTALLREHPGGDQVAGWPADIRLICRREKPHPGAQLSLSEQIDGWRYHQLLATNTPASTVQFLEARHRPHARVEDNVRCAKQTGSSGNGVQVSA